MNRFIIRVFMSILCAGMFAGCATTNHKSPILYKPLVKTSGGSGEVFLTMNNSQWYEPKVIATSRFMQKTARPAIRSKRKRGTLQKITLVNIKTDKGREIGKLVVPVYFGDFLIDALSKELSSVGYTVRLVQKLPRNVGNAIDISSISADFEQTSRLLSLEGTCRMQIQVDILRNGTKVGTHVYASKISDSSFSDRIQLFDRLMMKATQDILVESVPDIINDISTLRK